MAILKFGTAGVRGKYFELTPKEAYDIAWKTAPFFGEKVCIGMDGRNNSRALYNAVESALLYAGKTVYELGFCTTPTIQFYLEKEKLDAGYMITASHNPKDWNGVKAISRQNIFLDSEEGNAMLESGKDPELKPSNNVIPVSDAGERHAAAMASLVKIQNKSIRIAVDYGNGVGALVFSKALGLCGLKAYEMNKNIDGNFPARSSEPTKENLSQLISEMQKGKYDIGIAFDGDSDRVVFLDEKGDYIDGDTTFGLIVNYYLSEKGKGDIVSTVCTSKLVEDVATKYGVKTHYAKVGTTYIARLMLEHNAFLGGEEAGGLMHPELQLGKDGLFTALVAIEMLSKTGKKLSELCAEIPKYFLVKNKIEIPREKKELFVKSFPNYISGKYSGKILAIDGIRLDADNFWFIVRPSGTEDILRIFVEAKTKENAEKINKELTEEAKKLIEKL